MLVRCNSRGLTWSCDKSEQHTALSIWLAAAVQGAPDLGRGGAAYPAAGWDCREVAALWGAVVRAAVPPPAAHAALVVRPELAVPEPEEDREAVSVGLGQGCS